MTKWVFLNSDFIEEEKASLHFRDLSIQRGYGAFDFFRLIGNEPLFLDDHLDRFYFSAQAMHLPVVFSREELKSLISELVKKNNLPGTGVRLSITGGYSEDGFSIARPNILISQHSFTSPTESQRKTGIRLISYPFQRQLSHIKSIDYLMAIWLQPLRLEKGADDILYHHNGIVSECPRNNFFLVTNAGKLVTPKENVLKGVTRKKIIQLAKESFVVEERAVSLTEIKTAKEAFITSTTKQILPVTKIDDHIFNSTETSRHLLQLFRQTYNT